MAPAALLLATGTLVLVVSDLVRARHAVGVMAFCAPVASMIQIDRDMALVPDSHNLMGIEIIYAGIHALSLVVPGLFLGLVLRGWIRRRAA